MEIFRYWFHMINALALIKREFETMEAVKNRKSKGTTSEKRNRRKKSLRSGDKRPSALHIDPQKMSTST